MEEKEFNRREPKKIKLPKRYSIAMIVQMIMSIMVIVFALFYLTEGKFLGFLQLSFAICMFLMAFNNKLYYKRSKSITILYIATGIMIFLMAIGTWMGK